MEDSLILRKLEDNTLKRNKELARLRELIDNLFSKRVSYDVVKEYALKVSRTRSSLRRSMESCETSEVREEFVEPLQTLITFALMVSINDEEDMLTDLRNYLDNEGMYEEVRFVDGELMKLKELSALASRVLRNLLTSPSMRA